MKFVRTIVYALVMFFSLSAAIYYYSLSKKLAEQLATRSGTNGKEATVSATGNDAESPKKTVGSFKEALDSIPVDKAFPKEKTDLKDVVNLLDTDPQFEAALLTEAMATNDNYYSDFFLSQKLDPVTSEKLRALIAERQLEIFRQFAHSRSGGTEAAVRAFFTARMTMDNEIGKLIGNEKFAALQQYESTLSIRNSFEQYRKRMEYSGIALSNEQLERAITAVATMTPREEGKRQRNYLQPGRTESLKAEDLSGLSTVLTSEQYQFLHNEIKMRGEKKAIEAKYRTVFQNAFRQMR